MRFTIRQHKGTFHVSYATARADLFALDDLGLLKKQLEGKQFVFLAPDNILARLKNTPKAFLVKPEEAPEASADAGAQGQRELF